MSNLSPSVTDGVESIPVSDRLYCVGYLSPSVTFHAPILCLCDDYVCACPRSHSSPSLTFSCWTTDNPGLTLTFVPPSPPPPPPPHSPHPPGNHHPDSRFLSLCADHEDSLETNTNVRSFLGHCSGALYLHLGDVMDDVLPAQVPQ